MLVQGNKRRNRCRKRDNTWCPAAAGGVSRTAGASRASGTYATQQEAIDVARERARREGVELYIHGRDGRNRERSSYGRYTHPPKA
ncbi:DUF2188 domain-containing protein [Chelativorans petroleitrophicus]|uniref:DUF2188 domain-containing protein n=1 Tax=Chelativorans petroleitrophicus TaxID=2975484 RepID=UPI00311AFAAB